MLEKVLSRLYSSANTSYLLGALGLIVFLLFLPSGSGWVAHNLERQRQKLCGEEFPDYFKLSGVPLPEPLVNFSVNEAKPRPYRPFRWPYHQTMCEFPYVFKFHTYLDAYQACIYQP